MKKLWRGVDPAYLKNAELNMLKWAGYEQPYKDDLTI